MDQRRISMSDIVVGEPLPWDAYGEGNKLLLRRGQVVQSASQVEALIERGLFIDSGNAERLAHARQEAQAMKRETPSALRLINQALQRLERLLYNLNNETDAQTKIFELVKALTHATDISHDAVLASILLNQSAARYAVRHCVDTALLSLLIARAMKKTPEEIQAIMAAALTMNVGMLRQHDQLEAKAGPLSEAEAELVRSHTQRSVEILKQAGITHDAWLLYVQFHHEEDDGSGYPLGKAVPEIPQNAKILALADRYCAAVSNRAYRKPLLPIAALRDVMLGGGKPSDPMLVAYFIKELGTYPPGTFVRLQDGEIGVVTRQTKSPATPVVHAFIGPRGAPLSFPIQRDTGKELYAIREALSAQQAMLPFSMQQLWGDEAAL